MPWTAADFRAECIEQVRPEVVPHIRRTPLLRSAWLSERAGVDVHVKCENLQETGSFKVRGALAALSQLPPNVRKRGVMTASTGNHGAALAFAASRLGIPCTVAVPPATPQVKRDNIARRGASLADSPHAGYDATQVWALEQAEAQGLAFISPFEDPWVVAGNGGTLGFEILEDLPEVAEIMAPVGGGGLALGLALAIEARGSCARLTGVNTETCPAMAVSLERGEAQVALEGEDTLADAIEGGVGAINFELLRRRLSSVEVVPEERLAEAVAGLCREERLIAEGAGAAGPAAILNGYTPLGPCVVVLSGGNIDTDQLTNILRRG